MTKHFLFSTLLIFFISFHSKGQLSAIIEGGVNLSTVEMSNGQIFEPFGSLENRTVFYVSFIPKFNIDKLISFNTEIQYSLEGYKFEPGGFETKFHYLRFIPQIEFNPFSFLGIYGGYNFGLNISDVPPITIFSGIKNTTAKRTDSGFMAGVRFYVGKFSLTAKYNSGIKDINTLSYADDTGTPLENEIKNRNFQIGVGYHFF